MPQGSAPPSGSVGSGGGSMGYAATDEADAQLAALGYSDQLLNVRITKEPGQNLGISIASFKANPDWICIAAVRPGCIDAYNRTSPDSQIGQGDVIRSVNGITGFQAMADELKSAKDLNLTVARPSK
mmetsp:Transcript_65896/g.190106  ORF Transcript_65896/g.190106 Transcript_65896/m.190106 type:complete len:127 (-) Transcript_65896:97-477(-)